MYINFHPKKVNNLFIRLKEIFLQKNGNVGHVLELKPFQKPASELFVWKDNKGVSRVDGEMRGLSSDDLLVFLNTHEYKHEPKTSHQGS